MPKLVSWNVCGLKSIMRKEALAPLLGTDVDVIALQETRCGNETAGALFETLRTQGHGEYAHVAMQSSCVTSGYSGVSILSRLPFARLTSMENDVEGRVVSADFADFVLVNVYVKNSGMKALERLPDRVEWDERFLAYVKGVAAFARDRGKPLVVCGDFNAARHDIDVHRPERHRRSAGFTDEERGGLERLIGEVGLVDSFRAANPGRVEYSYWSNFNQCRTRDLGWRIDYFFFADAPLRRVRTRAADIMVGVRGSDHAPIAFAFDVESVHSTENETEAPPMQQQSQQPHLQNLQQENGTFPNRMPDLVAALEALQVQADIDGETHRARAFGRALASLRTLTVAHSIEDVATLPGVGPSIRATLAAVLEHPVGAVTNVPPAPPDPRRTALAELLTVTSIGPTRARALVGMGVAGVVDLRARVARGEVTVNAKEALGLLHWEDFNVRIPRAEMDRHRQAVLAVARVVAPSNVRVEVMGSYRRGAAESGDIDVAIIAPTQREASTAMASIVGRLLADGYALPGHFGFGPKKFLGIVRLPAENPARTAENPARRLDLMAVSEREAPFALLYFTGSGRYNVRVRAHAKTRGFSLNEHGLTAEAPAAADALAAHVAGFRSEADVLAFLGLPFVEPAARNE